MTPHSAGRVRLDAVFVQYDRTKYPGAAERFLAVLEAMGADYRLVLVDNAREGGWYHELSSRVFHVGGDNRAWEFSAFDRGREFLDATRGEGDQWPGPAEVWAFGTDAFTAYGDDYLQLLDPGALRFCLESQAAIGWIDSFLQPLSALGLRYRDWLRTSFVLLPSAVVSSLGALCTPLEEHSLFSDSPDEPFQADAPLSPELQQRLVAWLTGAPGESGESGLEQTWHSRFELTGESLDFFARKASAILREHLLSARLQAAGVPAFDLRLVAELARRGLEAGSLDAQARQRAAWNGWRQALAEPPWHLEQVSLPARFRHGEPQRLRVTGWVAPREAGGARAAGRAEVELSVGGLKLRSRCEELRPDVLEKLPQLGDGRCGFELERSLSTLQPGFHEVHWRIRGTRIERPLGRVQVLPRLEIAAELRWPQVAPPDEPCLLGLDAELVTSSPPDSIEVLWNGSPHEAGLEDQHGEVRERDVFGLYRCRLRGLLRVEPEVARSVQELELRFHAAPEGEGPTLLGTWRHSVPIHVAEAIGHRLSLRRISPLDPSTGLADVELVGWCQAEHGERLELSTGGKKVADISLSVPEPEHAAWRRFSLHRRLPFEPGQSTLRLEAVSATHERRLVQSWTESVRPASPTIEVDHLRVLPPEGRRREHLIFLSGWIEHHTAITQLRLLARVGEQAAQPIGEVPIDHSRDDVAAFRGDPLMRRQAFHVELPAELEAGAHELCLEASWLDRRDVLWRRSAAFEAPVAQHFLIESEALEVLEQGRLGPLRASIVIEGEVSSRLGEVTASLFVDGQLADRQSVADGGAFRLRHRPAKSGTWPVRVVFESFGRTLYDSGSVPVACELLRISPQLPSALEQFFDRLGIQAQLGLPAGADIACQLLEGHGEDLEAYEAMLQDIGRVFETAAPEHARVPEPPPEAPRPGRSLRVLVASWEVPCRRHGGGVYLSDLLQRLGSRHEITLVHGHGRQEEQWIEELRPSLHRVLSVPRRGRPLPSWAFEPSIRSVCTEYVPELRSTIESEVFSGRYDVVDYCYRWMLPHASRADVPQILTLLEDPFAARMSEALAGTTDDGQKLELLDRLLLAFHFTACVVPRRFRYVTTVNAADARWLRPLGGERVRVNGIGIDLERFLADGRSRPAEPRFVFVGNYRHPPSVEAARFAAEEVLPLLRQRIAGAELAIVGAHPTPELEELDQRDGVTVTGFVDDVRDWLRSATAFIAPIFTGAGTRVKVLEAMASGTPVIGSPLAFLGIGGEPGRHYLHAESVGQFVDACQQLARDRERAEGISKAARHWVEAHHGLDARAREREELWFQAARGARALPSVSGGR